MSRKEYILGHHYNAMKAFTLSLLALILVSGAYAQTQTTLWQGLVREQYYLDGSVVEGANCELISQKEVLVLTEVFADQENQREFRFSFNLPGKAPYDYNRQVEWGQHKVFSYAAENGLTVNGRRTSGSISEDGGLWTSANVGGGRRQELIKEGDNELVLFTVSDVPIKPGDLVARVEATVCSDKAWEQAGTPLIGEKALDCTYGVSQEIPDETGTLYICNGKPEQVTEVPEFGTWLLIVTGILGAGLVLNKR